MGAKSTIQWTDASWTPIRARVRSDAAEIAKAKGYTSLIDIAQRYAGHVGPHCEKVSAECDHCYSATNNHRGLPSNGTGLPFDRRARDLVDIVVDEKILVQPLHWAKPRKIFVCSQTDLFGEFVSDEQIIEVFSIMAVCGKNTFQVLTKRAGRMRAFIQKLATSIKLLEAAARRHGYTLQHEGISLLRWPIPNIWLGVSAGNQDAAIERIPELLKTDAAQRFVSLEPLIGPIKIDSWVAGLDQVIVGGESGRGARPMDLAWARNIKQQCAEAGTPYFFKQWGGVRDKRDTQETIPADLFVRECPA